MVSLSMASNLTGDTTYPQTFQVCCSGPYQAHPQTWREPFGKRQAVDLLRDMSQTFNEHARSRTSVGSSRQCNFKCFSEHLMTAFHNAIAGGSFTSDWLQHLHSIRIVHGISGIETSASVHKESFGRATPSQLTTFQCF